MSYTSLPAINYATGIPTTGYWAQNTVIINSAPAAGEPIGWICVQEGTPGTWAALGFMESTGVTLLTAAGVIPPGITLARITNTAAGTYTLPAPGGFGPGGILTILNTGGAASTLAAPAGAVVVGGNPAITAVGSFVRLLSDGGTNWFNVS